MVKTTEKDRLPVVHGSGDGETIQLKNDRFIYKLTNSQSGGGIAVIERTVAPSFQSPPQPHANTREDWICYVLEGRIGLQLNLQESTLDKGGFAFVPRGTFFRWWNPDPTPARMLTIYTPGAFSEFFREVVESLSADGHRIGDYARTLDTILEAQDRYGMIRKKT